MVLNYIDVRKLVKYHDTCVKRMMMCVDLCDNINCECR